MGFGEIASAAIMFIAVTSAATLLAFVFNNYANSASASISTRQTFMNEQLKSDITIENVLYDVTSQQVKVYVRNTGQSAMKINYTSAFIANERVDFSSAAASIEVISDTDTVNTGIWDSKETVLITSNQSITPGVTHTVAIITQYGVKDEYEFSI
ncbi:MAG: hypothetical protein ACOCWQ_02225 [Nanoarchaeota archaeon]